MPDSRARERMEKRRKREKEIDPEGEATARDQSDTKSTDVSLLLSLVLEPAIILLYTLYHLQNAKMYSIIY